MFCMAVFLKAEGFERGLSYIWICVVSKTKSISVVIHFDFSLFV